MSAPCELCGGACVGADLGPLIDERLRWLWEQVGAIADRRGDASLTRGALMVRAPRSVEHRSAATGLLGGRALKPGQTKRIDLGSLTEKIHVRGPALTPGAVAAHALGRPLAARVAQAAARSVAEARLQSLLDRASQNLLRSDQVWPALQRSGWVARILSATDPDRLLTDAISVLDRLPGAGARIDRRVLASNVTRDPHGLDDGRTLAGLCLALLVARGEMKDRLRPRDAWSALGVDSDDLTGGLITVGLHPNGWTVPRGGAFTLPPRVLANARWPSPANDQQWAFVTENPSVASAAAELASQGVELRLLCTSGTPSEREVTAVGALAAAGWHVAARADFDEAGLRHAAALLDGVPRAVPWRMMAIDYLASAPDPDRGIPIDPNALPSCSWDDELVPAMCGRGVAAYEEALLPVLTADLRRGRPDD